MVLFILLPRGYTIWLSGKVEQQYGTRGGFLTLVWKRYKYELSVRITESYLLFLLPNLEVGSFLQNRNLATPEVKVLL